MCSSARGRAARWRWAPGWLWGKPGQAHRVQDSDPAHVDELRAWLGGGNVVVTGQLVRVKAGWVHCVVKLQPCLKFAFEQIKLDKLVLYVGPALPPLVLYAQLHGSFGMRFDPSLGPAANYVRSAAGASVGGMHLSRGSAVSDLTPEG